MPEQMGNIELQITANLDGIKKALKESEKLGIDSQKSINAEMKKLDEQVKTARLKMWKEMDEARVKGASNVDMRKIEAKYQKDIEVSLRTQNALLKEMNASELKILESERKIQNAVTRQKEDRAFLSDRMVQGLEARYGSLGNTMKLFSKDTESGSGSMNLLSNSMGATSLKAKIALGAVAALGAGVMKLVDFVNEGNESLKKLEYGVAKTTSIMSQAEKMQFGGDLGAGVMDIRKETGDSIENITQALYNLQSAGFGGADAMKNLATVSKASVAGFTDMNTAVDMGTTLANAFGIDMKSAFDIIQQGTIKGKFTLAEINSSIGRVAAIAKDAGMSLEDVTGAISALTLKGVKAPEAVTALQGMINSFSQGNVVANFKKFNVEILDTQGNLKKFPELMTEIGKVDWTDQKRSMLQLSETGKIAFSILSKDATDSAGKVVSSYQSMMENFKPDAIVGTVDTAFNELSNTSEMAARRLEAQWDVFSQGLANVFSPLKTAYKTVVGGLVEGLNKLLFMSSEQIADENMKMAESSYKTAQAFYKTADSVDNLKNSYVQALKEGRPVKDIIDQIGTISPETAFALRSLGDNVGYISDEMFKATDIMDGFVKVQRELGNVDLSDNIMKMGEAIEALDTANSKEFYARDYKKQLEDNPQALKKIAPGMQVNQLTAEQMDIAVKMMDLDKQYEELAMKQAKTAEEQRAKSEAIKNIYKERNELQKSFNKSEEILVKTAKNIVDAKLNQKQIEEQIGLFSADATKQEALRNTIVKQQLINSMESAKLKDAEKLTSNQLLNLQTALTNAGYSDALTVKDKVNALNKVKEALIAQIKVEQVSLKLNVEKTKTLLSQVGAMEVLTNTNYSGQIANITKQNEAINSLQGELNAVIGSAVKLPEVTKPAGNSLNNLGGSARGAASSVNEADKSIKEFAKSLKDSFEDINTKLADFLAKPLPMADKFTEATNKIKEDSKKFTQSFTEDITKLEEKIKEIKLIPESERDITNKQLNDYEEQLEKLKLKQVSIEKQTNWKILEMQEQALKDLAKNKTDFLESQQKEELKRIQDIEKAKTDIANYWNKKRLDDIKTQLSDVNRAYKESLDKILNAEQTNDDKIAGFRQSILDNYEKMSGGVSIELNKILDKTSQGLENFKTKQETIIDPIWEAKFKTLSEQRDKLELELNEPARRRHVTTQTPANVRQNLVVSASSPELDAIQKKINELKKIIASSNSITATGRAGLEDPTKLKAIMADTKVFEIWGNAQRKNANELINLYAEQEKALKKVQTQTTQTTQATQTSITTNEMDTQAIEEQRKQIEALNVQLEAMGNQKLTKQVDIGNIKESNLDLFVSSMKNAIKANAKGEFEGIGEFINKNISDGILQGSAKDDPVFKQFIERTISSLTNTIKNSNMDMDLVNTFDMKKVIQSFTTDEVAKYYGNIGKITQDYIKSVTGNEGFGALRDSIDQLEKEGKVKLDALVQEIFDASDPKNIELLHNLILQLNEAIDTKKTQEMLGYLGDIEGKIKDSSISEWSTNYEELNKQLEQLKIEAEGNVEVLDRLATTQERLNNIPIDILNKQTEALENEYNALTKTNDMYDNYYENINANTERLKTSLNDISVDESKLIQSGELTDEARNKLSKLRDLAVKIKLELDEKAKSELTNEYQAYLQRIGQETEAKAKELSASIAGFWDSLTGGGYTAVGNVIEGIEGIQKAITEGSKLNKDGSTAGIDFAAMLPGISQVMQGVKSVTGIVNNFSAGIMATQKSFETLKEKQDEGTDSIYEYTDAIKNIANTIPILGEVVGMFTGLIDMTASIFGIETSSEKETKRKEAHEARMARIQRELELIEKARDAWKTYIDNQEKLGLKQTENAPTMAFYAETAMEKSVFGPEYEAQRKKMQDEYIQSLTNLSNLKKQTEATATAFDMSYAEYIKANPEMQRLIDSGQEEINNKLAIFNDFVKKNSNFYKDGILSQSELNTLVEKQLADQTELDQIEIQLGQSRDLSGKKLSDQEIGNLTARSSELKTMIANENEAIDWANKYFELQKQHAQELIELNEELAQSKFDLYDDEIIASDNAQKAIEDNEKERLERVQAIKDDYSLTDAERAERISKINQAYAYKDTKLDKELNKSTRDDALKTADDIYEHNVNLGMDEDKARKTRDAEKIKALTTYRDTLTYGSLAWIEADNAIYDITKNINKEIEKTGSLLDEQLSLIQKRMSNELKQAELAKGSALTEEEKLAISKKYFQQQKANLDKQRAEAVYNMANAKSAEEGLKYKNEIVALDGEILDLKLSQVSATEKEVEAEKELYDNRDDKLSLAQKEMDNEIKIAELKKGEALTDEEKLEVANKYYIKQLDILNSQLASAQLTLKQAKTEEDQLKAKLEIEDIEGSILDIKAQQILKQKELNGANTEGLRQLMIAYQQAKTGGASAKTMANLSSQIISESRKAGMSNTEVVGLAKSMNMPMYATGGFTGNSYGIVDPGEFVLNRKMTDMLMKASVSNTSNTNASVVINVYGSTNDEIIQQIEKKAPMIINKALYGVGQNGGLKSVAFNN